MPVQKKVLPVSTLCVEKITQLLIEIVSTGNHPCKKSSKSRHMLDISSIKRENVRGKLSPVTSRKKTEDAQKLHHMTASHGNQGDGSNGVQLDTKTFGVSENLPNGNCPAPQNTSAGLQDAAHQKTLESPEQYTQPGASHQNALHQDTHTPSELPHQDSSEQKLLTSPERNTPLVFTHQDTPAHLSHEDKSQPDTPTPPFPQDVLIKSPCQDTPYQNAPTSPSPQKTPTQPPHQDTPPDCMQESPPSSPEMCMLSGKQKRMAVLVRELGVLLESLSHAALHSRLFSSVAEGLDATYMRDKATRGPIQDIISQFVNFALLELDFGKARMFSEASMCKVLFDHLDNATRLETLIIDRSCYWRTQIFDKLNEKLANLPHLTVLKIQFICTPEMIEGLSEKCPALCELSLKGSEKIADEHCSEIAKCSGLQSLDISGTRITGRGCWKILDAVKDLSWLHHCAFNCNSDSLLFESRADLFAYVKEQLRRGQAERLPPGQLPHLRDATFSLRNFWLFNPFTSDLLTTTLCPRLTHLRLDFIFQDLQEEPEVEILASLTQLTKLEVNFYDRCSVDLVSQMISGSGPRLTSLHLHLADDWFFAAQVHNVVASCCPNLVSLTYTGDYKVRHSLEECDDKLDFELPAPAHPHLQHLKIVGVVSDQRLRFMLLHCPALVTLHLDGELEWLHDDTFTQALQLNPLPNLQELWFNVSTTVTLETVDRVLHEDNQVTTVGRLCHMAGSSMEQYQLLRSYVIQHNLDVKLIWVTDERVQTR